MIDAQPKIERTRASIRGKRCGPLEAAGLRPISVMRDEPHTAQAAAEALGISVAEIAKSIIFRGRRPGGPSDHRWCPPRRRNKVERAIGKPVGKADAEFVRAGTGFVIGGVAPLGPC